MKPDFSKGLIPAVIVDDHTNDVLMLAYMDEKAYEKTLETNETWFYSRSRKEYWNKGATSGNKQIVQSIQLDCDQDTLLIHVKPLGPACHTGDRTCFNEVIRGELKETMPIYNQLFSEIKERKAEPAEGSYTNYLFTKGIDKISKKLIEEAGEVIIAAKNNDPDEVVNECSDLVYHMLVLLAEQGVELSDVEAELTKRSSKKGNVKEERKEITDW